MTIADLQRQIQRPQGFDDRPKGLPSPRERDAFERGDFQDTLEYAMDRVDRAHKDAEAELTSFVTGETDDLHEVMISMNQAKLSFQMMVEVRNKMLDTYQELMRMQV